ncbi:MAG: pyrroline-5-carboxylate reductase [Nitrospirae bacterium RBG_13_43_8]|nr:MAG: pyrroline-5-carboxylate reductase [Nitrospirae bacterium RBG_13_43_8]
MIGFIGGGNMAEAVIKGITHRYTGNIIVSEPRDERREYLEKTYNIKTTPRNRDVASSADIIILAVKPQEIGNVLDEISDVIPEEKTVLSIAAGITLSYLSTRLKTRKIVRIMPNTPALIQEGMSVMSMCECINEKDIEVIRDIFMSVGRLLTLPEKYMDAVTALSGSGPAFIAYFVEAMIEGGVRTGLSEDNANALAVQTLLGTARLLDTGMNPSKLREMVTSPKGTTAAGLAVFEEKGLKEIVVAAIAAATERAKELGKS